MLVKKIAILFSGSGSNMQEIIKKIHNKKFGKVKIEVALLICNNPNAAGIQKAKNLGFETIIIEHKNFDNRADFDKELIKHIKQENIDLVVLAGFMRILGEEFCKQIKAINLHPSLLPLFKGAHAIEESFNSNMQVGGVSIHWVNNQLDGGEIIAQAAFKRKNKNFQEWEKKIHQIEHKLLPKVIISLLCESKI